MADTITGGVQAVAGPNKGGFYSIKVNDVFYGAGKSRPDVEKGDTVRFDFYKKDGKYPTITGDIKKKPGAPAGKASGGGYGGSRDEYFREKDRYDKEVKEPRISFYAAYERAVQFTQLVLTAGALKLPAKDADKLDVLDKFVIEKTRELVVASSGAKPSSADAEDPTPEAEAPETTESEGEDEGWT